ncbi:diguanylate cyclase [Aquabacter sp. L1I39]|uniref:diguanylate cyclase n=1 Tax=Aquabacter sp. L1I39 TaxID=2820278 RepID=UPI001ADCFFBD|nr:diguanylate cyclase [Aquabacter sp. L1I39]QTL05883.1 diguanylate cyclase [Aquabacter sp. L1I39]
MSAINPLLIAVEMLVYLGTMLGLFRIRRIVGLGALFTAIGVVHVMAVYLSLTFYMALPLGLAFAPSGIILYSGLLSILLLVYLREGEAAAWQPVYGLLFGCFLLAILLGLLGLERGRVQTPYMADLPRLGQAMILNLWSALIIFLSAVLIFPLLDVLLRRLGQKLWLSLWLTLFLVGTLAQILFFPALQAGFELPIRVALDNWIASAFLTALYAGVIVGFLKHVEGVPVHEGRLAIRSADLSPRVDPLTGAIDDSRFEGLARNLLDVAAAAARPVSLIQMDVQSAREARERADATSADAFLLQVARTVAGSLRVADLLIRRQGDTLLVIAPGVPHHAALQVATMLRDRTLAAAYDQGTGEITLAIGVATAPADGETPAALLSAADQRVYAAKVAGLNRVVGASDA